MDRKETKTEVESKAKQGTEIVTMEKAKDKPKVISDRRLNKRIVLRKEDDNRDVGSEDEAMDHDDEIQLLTSPEVGPIQRGRTDIWEDSQEGENFSWEVLANKTSKQQEAPQVIDESLEIEEEAQDDTQMEETLNMRKRKRKLEYSDSEDAKSMTDSQRNEMSNKLRDISNQATNEIWKLAKEWLQTVERVKTVSGKGSRNKEVREAQIGINLTKEALKILAERAEEKGESEALRQKIRNLQTDLLRAKEKRGNTEVDKLTIQQATVDTKENFTYKHRQTREEATHRRPTRDTYATKTREADKLKNLSQNIDQHMQVQYDDEEDLSYSVVQGMVRDIMMEYGNAENLSRGNKRILMPNWQQSKVNKRQREERIDTEEERYDESTNQTIGNRQNIETRAENHGGLRETVQGESLDRSASLGTSAVTITIDGKDVTYGEILRRARKEINLSNMGIMEPKIKAAINGGIIIEINGENKENKADMLAKRLENLFRDPRIKIQKPLQRGEMVIYDMDSSIQPSDIAETVQRFGKCKADEIKIGSIKPMKNGLNMTWLKCPLVNAHRMAEKYQVKIGWTVTRVIMLRRRPVQCFRCLEYGHVRMRCSSDQDHTGACFNCGAIGHKLGECLEAVNCPLCQRYGMEHMHRVGSIDCMKNKKMRLEKERLIQREEQGRTEGRN